MWTVLCKHHVIKFSWWGSLLFQALACGLAPRATIQALWWRCPVVSSFLDCEKLVTAVHTIILICRSPRTIMALKKRPLRTLSAGRPPAAHSQAKTMSRKASRTLINKHHQLEKQKKAAERQGDGKLAADLATEITKLGGLSRYQQASLQGQSSDRGGDTSKILLDWLPVKELQQTGGKLKMLEVGALSVKNACSNSGIFEVSRIDLNSQEPGILKQDFMKRPMATTDDERFDIISLSLVLNFVPDAATRGDMLRRTTSFLKQSIPANANGYFPSLFLVLPRSCTDNSRYFTYQQLDEIMRYLGYRSIQKKLTQKLIYTLWAFDSTNAQRGVEFTKKELNPGRTRNNFIITLKKTS